MVHHTPESAFVHGDQKRLVQTVVNLLNNAAKYTPEGGNITVTVDVQDEHVVLSVSDNGIGMEAELVDRAFELFAQAERSIDRSEGGLGIGLALVKSLVELHGGTVSAYSSGLGRGSEFTIRLPRLRSSDMPSLNSPAHFTALKSQRPLRVMIVDDNVDAATMLAMLIEAAGHEVFVEYESRRALERARSILPDVCLLDIGLPDMNGNELARALRAIPDLANTVLVAVTGYGQPQDRENSFAAGFGHHFMKPVDSAKLTLLLAEIARAASAS
jgi:CheY-like chemotaxis protein/anti-sigma regulatory factor (Ser/Thr protein kinase)